jgi:EAL domain-containing protein (putative c-di-GMP-specific phosphodiesterase class I)
VFLSASVGLLIVGPDGPPPDSSGALRDADQALYEAKAAGRSQVVEFRPKPLAQRPQRTSIGTELRYALSRDELILHYQPILVLGEHRVVGAEALARWRPGRGEMVAPSDFIPVAEQMGVINDFGRWILDRACRDASAWRAHHETMVSVNISGRQLNDPAFAETVVDALDRSGLPASALVLELDGSHLAAETSDRVLRAELDRLRAEGVRIAVDNFDVGHGPPSSMTQLPIDIVKIDSSPTLQAHGSAAPDPSWAVLRETLQMIAERRLAAVAVGIETPAQAHALEELNCPYGQGYYFSPPITASAIEDLLHRSGTARRPERARAPKGYVGLSHRAEL